MRKTKQECVRALRAAAKRLGKSPTRSEYDALGLSPTSSAIMKVMGSWNEAKDAAGLETYPQWAVKSRGIAPQPDDVELPEGYVWDELNPQQRWYYKNREHPVAVKSRRKQRLRTWFTAYKREHCQCSRCGEDHPACLDFHHVGEKELGVSAMVTLGYSKDSILKEVERCLVLCANCHRKEHHGDETGRQKSDKD